MFGGDSHANDREDDDRKESKKDKGYVAFHSDDSDNLEEVDEDVRLVIKTLLFCFDAFS
mgnify:CR=1 FL=1